MTERAAPFYCPYCGEEDLRPFGEQHGEWRCGACLRVFRLSYRGLTAPGFEQFDASGAGRVAGGTEVEEP
jgi:predicted RNA-binding Zn-ribbon protein involved in translation (DUF1610 family)